MQPVTKRQKLLAHPIVVGVEKDKREANGEEKGKKKTIKTDTELRPFNLLVEDRIFSILRNCVSFLRVVGPQISPTLLVNQDMLAHVDWDAFKPLFTEKLSLDVRIPVLTSMAS